MTSKIVIDNGEIYLASFDTDTGQLARAGRFPLVPGSAVQPILTGQFPPVIAINEDGRDTQPFASTVTMAETTAGLGILEQDSGGNLGRFWFATANTRHKRQVTLLPLKTERANAAAGSKAPRAGASFNDRVYVAFDDDVYYWTSAVGWSAAVHSFASGAVPLSDPLLWNGKLYWFLGDSGLSYTDGSTWTDVAKAAQAGVVVGDILYIVDDTGQVSKVATDPTAPGDFTAVATVNATGINGMLAYLNASSEVVPFVVSDRGLYVIDPDTGTSAQAGPQFQPSPYPVRADILTSDNQVYMAQGQDVISWDGDTAQNVGLNNDDGLPAEFSGGIRKLVNGNTTLFALLDAAVTTESIEIGDVFTGDPYRDVIVPGESFTLLVGREASGWHTWAVSDAAVTEATMLFISDAEDAYRLWFAWDGTVYTVDIPLGFFNPLDDPNGAFEASGYIIYPKVSFGYYEASKIGLLVQCRTARCSDDATNYARIKLEARFDESDTWYPLYDQDGNDWLTTNGRHSFDLHASPIPTGTDPLTYADDPAVGFKHDSIQIRATLERGADSSISPSLVWVGVHVLKSVYPLRGWTASIDLSREYKGHTAFELDNLLTNLMLDNVNGLLHWCYRNTDGSGAEPVYAVKVTGYQASENTGTVATMAKRVRLSLTEVTTRER